MHLQLLHELVGQANFTVSSMNDSASGSLGMKSWHSHGQADIPSLPPTNATWSAAAAVAQLIQDCGVPGSNARKWEEWEVVVLLAFLSVSVIVVMIGLASFRDDKEEDITPLCPQLIVKDAELSFTFPLDDASQDRFEIHEPDSEKCLFNVATDWPSSLRSGTGGVCATARLQKSNSDFTLATVVARNVSVVGQGIALCRAGYEIFGFVEPDGPETYQVKHRTGVKLLTLVGDFDQIDIVGMNPVNSKVCWFKCIDETCIGKVSQHVDAGLIICSLVAARVHRRLALMLKPLELPLPGPPKSRDDASETPSVVQQKVPQDADEKPDAGDAQDAQERPDADGAGGEVTG